MVNRLDKVTSLSTFFALHRLIILTFLYIILESITQTLYTELHYNRPQRPMMPAL